MTLVLAVLGSLSILLWVWPRTPVVTVAPGGTAIPAFFASHVAASSAMVVVAIGAAVRSPTIAVIGPALVGMIAVENRRRRTRRMAADRAAGTVACLDRIATQLRAGASLSGSFLESLSDVSISAGHPLGVVVDRLNSGVPLVRALAETVVEAEDGDVRLVATTVEVLSHSGGSAVAALERTGDTVRERAAAEADARVQAQQATTSAAVLAVLPVAFAGLGAASEPDLARFYLWHPLGTTCLVAAIVLVGVGWLWMDRLVWGS